MKDAASTGLFLSEFSHWFSFKGYYVPDRLVKELVDPFDSFRKEVIKNRPFKNNPVRSPMILRSLHRLRFLSVD